MSKSRLLAAVLAIGLALPAAAATRPDSVIVFGDSLVDAGNAYIGSGGLTAQPGLGYVDGRFTNGYDYTDILNQRLTGAPTTAYLAGGDNYAIGGARAAGDATLLGFNVLGLNNQLAIYSAASGGVADPDALYVINFGNNDVNAIQSGDTYGLSAAQYSALYVLNIVNAVAGLNAAGATKILVAGVPNPGEPEGVALQAQLDLALDAITPALTTSLYRFDFFDFFTRVQARPDRYGLPANTDFTTPCIPGQLLLGFPPDCTGYFSFDGTHPTAPVHVALAKEVGRLIGIGGVPEPALWLQLIAGFGVAGTAMRRRRAIA